MSVPENLRKLVGEWKGINGLYLPWISDDSLDSPSKATIALTANFLKIEYDWIYEEKKQEGLILLGEDKESGLIKAFWIDSWHLSDKYMVSEGIANSVGAISIKGFYTVPNHPDWGWRTVIETPDADTLKIIMYNVSPEGEETLAVEANYSRQ